LRVRIGKKEVLRYAGPDLRTAEEVRADTMTKVRREKLLGERVIPAVTFREFESAIKRDFAARHSPTTQVSELGRLKRCVAWFGSTLRDIGPAEVQDFFAHLRTKENFKHSAVNRYACLLSIAFKLAVAKGYARTNPLKEMPRGREQALPVPFVSKADVDRLVAATTNPRFGAYLRVLADTGIRRSEGTALEWRDVHLARRRIVIRRSKNKGTREIDLTHEAVAAFEFLAKQRGAIPMQGADLVWPEFAEKRADAPSAWFHTVAKRAGLRLRLHDLRHGYCSRLAQAGIALPTIMALAGHTSWQTTQRYATHLPEGATRAAIDKLERHERRHSSKSQQGKQAETK